MVRLGFGIVIMFDSGQQASPDGRTSYGSLTVMVVLLDTTGGERRDSTLAAFIEIQGRF